MFKSDNVGNMNVTTTLFQGSNRYLTLVTRDGQPWDFMEALEVNSAQINHLTAILACGNYQMDNFLSNREVVN